MPSASAMANGEAPMKISVLRERLPEDVVVEQHLLVVVEAGPAGRFQRRPVLHRQQHVPAERQHAIEEEDRQRRQQEAGNERQLARALALPPAVTPLGRFTGRSACRRHHPRFSSRATLRSASASAVLASLRPSSTFCSSGQNASLTLLSLPRRQLPTILSVCSSWVFRME